MSTVDVKYLKDESGNIISPVVSTKSVYNTDGYRVRNCSRKIMEFSISSAKSSQTIYLGGDEDESSSLGSIIIPDTIKQNYMYELYVCGSVLGSSNVNCNINIGFGTTSTTSTNCAAYFESINATSNISNTSSSYPRIFRGYSNYRGFGITRFCWIGSYITGLTTYSTPTTDSYSTCGNEGWLVGSISSLSTLYFYSNEGSITANTYFVLYEL